METTRQALHVIEEVEQTAKEHVTGRLPEDTGQSPEGDDPGLIGVLDLLVPLIRRRYLLLLCTIVGLLLGLLWTTRKGIYVAVTTVLPPQSSVTSGVLGQIGSLAGIVGGAGLSAQHSSQDLYVSLLQSPSLQDAVVRRFGLDKVYKASSPGAARFALDHAADRQCAPRTADAKGKGFAHRRRRRAQ